MFGIPHRIQAGEMILPPTKVAASNNKPTSLLGASKTPRPTRVAVNDNKATGLHGGSKPPPYNGNRKDCGDDGVWETDKTD